MDIDLHSNGYKFQEEPLELEAIYILNRLIDDYEAPLIEQLSIQEALITLITNTWTTHLLDKAQRAREFKMLNNLITRTPVKRVNYSKNQHDLSRYCELIVNDIHTQ